MKISRVVIKNFRSLESVDVSLSEMASLVIGENNTGKSNFIHAIRLCLDYSLPSSYRMLGRDDVYSAVNQAAPFQIFVGIEFTGFKGNDNEEAMLYGATTSDNTARIFYRFRPKRKIREELESGALTASLTIDDYVWELFCGGNPDIDLAEIEWNMDSGDFNAVKFDMQSLQSYLVVYLPALRDVETDLQHSRKSSLLKLVDASDISREQQEKIVEAVKSANTSVEALPSVKGIATSIDKSLKELTGTAFGLDVDLGLSSPSFHSIVRNLIILLSNHMLKDFEPRRNGLGLNNILYISMLIEQFRKRIEKGKSAGQLILIEEPEAHLHPQLQSTFFSAIREMPFQSIATTHSTQISSKAPLSSYITLTTRSNASTYVAAPTGTGSLSKQEIADLERYLDATKSNLLFARNVMLVEGAAELILIPALVRKVLKIDLEREGISLVAIHGTHFSAFSKLFADRCLPKRCAIVADADMDDADFPTTEDTPEKENLSVLEGAYVKCFLGQTTLEREITHSNNLDMLIAATSDLGAPKIKKQLEIANLLGGEVRGEIKDKVLRTAIRFGKARFAQTTARHVNKASFIPKYIEDAVKWLLEK